MRLRSSTRSWAVALLALVCLLACATRGARFDADALPRIRPGRTTESEIRAWFGSPLGVRVNSSGATVWSYLYEETKRRDTGTLTKIGASIASILGSRVFIPPVDIAYEMTTRHELEVLFREGVVADYTYERRETPARVVY
jgi:outer membrane protein assembly factor BamE (lipoprotein component of BamABCDE complex)